MAVLRRAAPLGITSSELLFLAVILGIVGSLVFFALGGKREEGRDEERKADIHRIATAVELYFNDHVKYPQSSVIPVSIPGFLPVLPRDPVGEEYGWVDNSAASKNASQDFCLFARLEKEGSSGGASYIVAGPLGVREREVSSEHIFTLEDCE